MKTKKWFEAKAGDSEGVAKITIDGEIGRSWWDDDSVASSAFMNEIKAFGDLTEIVIDMNSPGGAVTDGLTIANYLKQHSAKVVVNVLGQASSIASVIAAAADEVHMGLGAFMMVHQPWTVVVGNADNMRAMAMDLDTINGGIIDAYVAKVGEDKRSDMEDAVKGTDGDGTILSASAAIDLGLADSMLEINAAASVSAMAKSMARAAEEAKVLLDVQTPEDKPMTTVQALALAFDLEPDQIQAENLAEWIQGQREKVGTLEASTITLAVLQAHHPELVTEIQNTTDHGAAVETALTAESERIMEILKACATTGDFSNLEKLITEKWEAKQASDYILAAAAGGQHIHGTHSPEGGQNTGINSGKIYADRLKKQG